MPYTPVATTLPRTTLWGDTRDFAFAVLRDADGAAWCGLCLAESCAHTGTAPVRRKASGGKRKGSGRPRENGRQKSKPALELPQ